MPSPPHPFHRMHHLLRTIPLPVVFSSHAELGQLCPASCGLVIQCIDIHVFLEKWRFCALSYIFQIKVDQSLSGYKVLMKRFASTRKKTIGYYARKYSLCTLMNQRHCDREVATCILRRVIRYFTRRQSVNTHIQNRGSGTFRWVIECLFVILLPLFTSSPTTLGLDFFSSTKLLQPRFLRPGQEH